MSNVASPRSARQRKNSGKEAGQAVLLLALVLAVLFGIAGLALDGGHIYWVKRRIQIATDAGARAAASELKRGNSNLVVTAAKKDSALNGFPETNAAITVNHPPASGPKAGNNDYAEVIISQAVPITFMGLFFNGPVTVAARSVAGIVNAPSCVYVLNPTAEEAFTFDDTTINLGCGVKVESNHPTLAMRVQSGSCITAQSIKVVGGYDDFKAACTTTPVPETGADPGADPLAYLAPPDASGPCDQTNYVLGGGGTATLNPGVYCGGIHVQAASSLTLNGGTYILRGGGLRVEGNSSLQGDLVTLYFTYDATWAYDGLWLSNSSVNLSAPGSGVLFFQDRTAPGPGGSFLEHFIEGNGGAPPMSLAGAVYFPTQRISIDDMALTLNAPNCAGIIADTLEINGKGSVITIPDCLGLEGSPINRVAVVE